MRTKPFKWYPDVEWSAIPNKEMEYALPHIRSSSAAVSPDESAAKVWQEEIIKNRLFQKKEKLETSVAEETT